MPAKKIKPIPAPVADASPKTAYVPTVKESAIAQGILDRRQKQAPLAKYRVAKRDGVLQIDNDHADQAVGTVILMNAVGSTNGIFTEALTRQIANIAANGSELTADDLNGVVAMIQGIGPKDETEAMLAAQMVAIHNATMTAARRLNHVDNIPQQDSASNMLNKLARTFATQIEALKKYRSTGEQSIRVQHVTVNDGGQAIVGTVQTGGGGTHKTGGQPHEPSQCSQFGPAMLGHVETLTATLPGPGGQGLECVPLPRRPQRSAKGDG